MKKEIRTIGIDAYDDIIRVWMNAGLPIKPNGRERRDFLERELSREYVRCFGLFLDEVMVGVGIANYDGRRGWVNRVAIDPDYRGQGLGGEIIQACEEFLNGFGETLICCLIEEENLPSMACFRKAGYSFYEGIMYWSKRPRADL